jgi:hypothetical protein
MAESEWHEKVFGEALEHHVTPDNGRLLLAGTEPQRTLELVKHGKAKVVELQGSRLSVALPAYSRPKKGGKKAKAECQVRRHSVPKAAWNADHGQLQAIFLCQHLEPILAAARPLSQSKTAIFVESLDQVGQALLGTMVGRFGHLFRSIFWLIYGLKGHLF